VTLRKPPPLDKPLLVYQVADQMQLRDASMLIAEARPAVLDLPVPKSVPFADAVECSKAFPGFQQHLIPGCFVCGTDRGVGDGLRVWPGSGRAGEPLVAPFVPDESLADEAGWVRPEFLWAALDCPGYFAAAPGAVAPLGRMTADVSPGIRAGDRCVVLSWSLGRAGRKIFAGTALYGQDGALYGRSSQVWIEL
jgi:hypothetical protein